MLQISQYIIKVQKSKKNAFRSQAKSSSVVQPFAVDKKLNWEEYWSTGIFMILMLHEADYCHINSQIIYPILTEMLSIIAGNNFSQI